MNYYVYASAVLLYCFTLLQLFSNICSTEHDSENNRIKIWNNGKGIPVVEHKEEKMYVPTLIFGHLLTSSNYNDFEKKVTGKLFTLIKIFVAQFFRLDRVFGFEVVFNSHKSK